MDRAAATTKARPDRDRFAESPVEVDFGRAPTDEFTFKTLSYHTSGAVGIVYAPTGLICTFDMPFPGEGEP